MNSEVDWSVLVNGAAIACGVVLTGYAALRFGRTAAATHSIDDSGDAAASGSGRGTSLIDRQAHLDLAYHNARREIAEREAEMQRFLEGTTTEFRVVLRKELNDLVRNCLEELREMIATAARQQSGLGRFFGGPVALDGQLVAERLASVYDEERVQFRDAFVAHLAETLGDSLSAYDPGGSTEVGATAQSNGTALVVGSTAVGAAFGALFPVAGIILGSVALIGAGMNYQSDDEVERENMNRIGPLVRGLFVGNGYRTPGGELVISLKNQILEDAGEISKLVELSITDRAAKAKLALDRRYRELSARPELLSRIATKDFHDRLIAGEASQFLGPGMTSCEPAGA